MEDAGKATDHEGRKVIAAQDFVDSRGIKSVFGVGGAYPSGQVMVLVAFCVDRIPKSVATLFLPVAETFLRRTADRADPARVFSD